MTTPAGAQIEPCSDLRAFPKLLLLLACVQKKLEECPFDLCWLGVQPGDSADLTPVGESGSMAWVRLAGVFPVRSEIGVDNRVRCTSRLNMSIEVGFATCYPINDDGSPLSVNEDLEIAESVSRAMMALWAAVVCCEWDEKNTREVGQWQPLGPMGGVVGGIWSVDVEV